MIYFRIALLTLAGTTACSSIPSATPPPVDPASSKASSNRTVQYAISDVHLHFVDFLQETDGIQAVLKAMNEAGVTDTMISGMPLVKRWDATSPTRPTYYLADDSKVYWYSLTDVIVARAVQSLPPEDRRRFHPFISGFNSTDRNAVDHVKRMLEWYPDFWEGIGEVMTRHDDLTALTYGEVGRADHIALEPIYQLAAEHKLPVSIHSDISSVWVNRPLYLPEFETAVARHPKTKFIWCHAGISRRIKIPNLTEILSVMLKKYSNLWIDLSWVVFEEYIAPQEKVDPKWVELIGTFPDRFVIGSDKVGTFGNYKEEILKYNLLLDRLTKETAVKVAHDNYQNILNKEK